MRRPLADPARPVVVPAVTALLAALAVVVAPAACTPPGPTSSPTSTAAVPSVRSLPPDPATPTPTPTPAHQPPAAADALERAVWVHLFDATLKTRDGIRRVVADLVSADATAVIAEVVRRHDAYYDSAVLPRTADPELEPGLDVLAALVEEAHAAGLEVHAWVPVAPTWHEQYAGLPAPAGWVATAHGPDAPEADRWVTRTVDGAWEPYLDPALPEVRAHVAAVVGEIAERYPVDGIHLDYVRYASAEHGYHPAALARYAAETGATGTPALEDPAWSDWRRAQVTELVRAARDAVRATGSSAVVSAAVIAWGDGPGGPTTPSFADTRAYQDTLQDWPSWAAHGVVDAVLPMDYFRESDADQAAWLRTWLAFEADLAQRTGARVVPGVAGYLNAPDAASTQVSAAMQALGAVALYSYQGSTDDPARPLWADLAASGWGRPPG